MKFKKTLEKNLGKNTRVHSPGKIPINGKLIKINEMYLVGEHYKPLNPEEISSTREGKILDIELERGSDYFQGGFLN